MTDPTRASVIIATALNAVRAGSIAAAVESVLGQQPDPAIPLLVANGPNVDARLMSYWRTNPKVRFFHLEEGNLPAAIRFGREQVDTPYFGFLDDDDIYLPQAVAARIRALNNSGGMSYDVAVTNGWREKLTGDEPCFSHMRDFAHDPLRSLTAINWLPSCAGLFRTAMVGPEYFDGRTKYLEWTVAAFRIALKLRIAFSDEFTFRISDSGESLSKSPAYLTGIVGGIEEIARMDLPDEVRHAIRRKHAAALHDVAVDRQVNGALLEAWKTHVRCLAQREGLRYLPYTLRLLTSSAQRLSRTPK